MKVSSSIPAHGLWWIALSAVLSACSTMADVVGNKNDGTARVYDVSSDRAWELAKIVFRTEGADAIEEHRDQSYMLTSSGSNFYSSGAVMGAWIEPSGGNRMNVTVVTKRRVKTNLFTTLTEGTFHRRFAQGVRIVNTGNSLPTMLPDSYEATGGQPVVRKTGTPYVADREQEMPLAQFDGSCRLPETHLQVISVDAASRQEGSE